MKSVLFSSPSFLRLSLCGDLGVSDLGRLLPEARPVMQPNDQESYDLLADLSQVTSIDCCFASIAALVRARQTLYEQASSTNRPPERIVIWAPEDLPFGICRMLEQLVLGCLPIEMSVVREESEALSLLRGAQAEIAEPATQSAEAPAPSNSQPPSNSQVPSNSPAPSKNLSASVIPGILGLPRTA